MPKLDNYTAKLSEAPAFGGRRATADDFAPAIPASDISKAVSGYVSDLEENESRAALVESAELRAKYARALDEAALTGADLTALKDKMYEDFSSVGEKFGTKKGLDMARMYAANAEIMFDQQANNINVTRASATARTEATKLVSTQADMVRANPSYLPIAQETIKAFFDTYQNKLPPEMRAQLTEQMSGPLRGVAVSAAIHASTNLDETRKQIEANVWKLSPEQQEHALGKLKEEERGRRIDEDRKRARELEQRKEKVELAESQLIDGITKGKTTWATIRDHPDLQGPEATNTKKSLLLMMDAWNRRGEGAARKEDEAAKLRLFIDINRPHGDPLKIHNPSLILDEVQKRLDGKSGGIGVEHAAWLMGQIRQQDPQSTKLSGLASQVIRDVKNLPAVRVAEARGQDLASQIGNEYVAAVRQRADALRNTGERGVDPEQLFDPKSSNYVGPGSTFRKQLIEDVLRRNTEAGAAAAKQQGATPVRSQAEFDALPPGTTYVDPNGNVGVKVGKKAPPVSDFQAWSLATGGVLRPGQTQEQAVKEWKAKQ